MDKYTPREKDRYTPRPDIERKYLEQDHLISPATSLERSFIPSPTIEDDDDDDDDDSTAMLLDEPQQQSQPPSPPQHLIIPSEDSTLLDLQLGMDQSDDDRMLDELLYDLGEIPTSQTEITEWEEEENKGLLQYPDGDYYLEQVSEEGESHRLPNESLITMGHSNTYTNTDTHTGIRSNSSLSRHADKHDNPLVIDTTPSTITEPPPLLSPFEELTLLASRGKPNSPDDDDDDALPPSAPRSTNRILMTLLESRDVNGPMVMEEDDDDDNVHEQIIAITDRATNGRPASLSEEEGNSKKPLPAAATAVGTTKADRAHRKSRAVAAATQPGAVAVSEGSSCSRSSSSGSEPMASNGGGDTNDAKVRTTVASTATGSRQSSRRNVASHQSSVASTNSTRSEDRAAKRQARRSRGSTAAPGAVAVSGHRVEEVEEDGPSMIKGDDDDDDDIKPTARGSQNATEGPARVSARATRRERDRLEEEETGEQHTEQLENTDNAPKSRPAQQPGPVPVKGGSTAKGRVNSKFNSLNENQRSVGLETMMTPRPSMDDVSEEENLENTRSKGNSTGDNQNVTQQEGSFSWSSVAMDPEKSSFLAAPRAESALSADGSELSIAPTNSSITPLRSRPEMNQAHSAKLVTAEVYDPAAKREAVRRQAEKDEEERILASAITAEAKVIEDDERGSNWKLYGGIGGLLLITVAVVVSLVATTRGDSSGPKLFNDSCQRAVELSNITGGRVQGDILGKAGDIEDVCQVEFGEGYGLWYFFEGEGSRLSSSTCNGTDLDADSDTQLMVFAGSCDNLECIAGSDQLCEAHGAVGWMAEEGTRYYMVVKGFRPSNEGSFNLTVDALAENDRCEIASEVDSFDSPLFGSTRSSTVVENLNDCGQTRAVAPGAWYRVEGGGDVRCASAYSERGSPDFPVQLSIYMGNSCTDLSCVDGVIAISSSETTWLAETAWLAEEGVSYFILVHGDELEAEGDFLLNLFTTPTNGICQTAQTVQIGANLTSGTITNACSEDLVDCPGVIDQPGVWYAVTGTGNLLIASASGLTCQDDKDGKTAQVSVFSGASCSTLECVDFVQEACTAEKQTTSQWFSNPGELYYLFVQGSDSSDFTLTVDKFIPEVTDDCESAADLDGSGDAVLGSTDGATPDVLGSCVNSTSPGVFYRVKGTGQELTASTCNPGTNFSTDITVLTGSCDDFECVNTTTVSCDGVRSIAFWSSLPGETYLIYIHAQAGTLPNAGRFDLTLGEGGLRVENDFCGTAVELSIPSTAFGSTENATMDDVDLCGNANTAPGVWYSVIGRGSNLTASLCGDGTEYDTQIYIFSGSCDMLTCIADDDDTCMTQSAVTWTAEEDEMYFVLVGGFNDEVGNFELILAEE